MWLARDLDWKLREERSEMGRNILEGRALGLHIDENRIRTVKRVPSTERMMNCVRWSIVKGRWV